MSNANTFNFFSNVFGFIVAAVSLAAFLFNIFLYHHPRNRIKKLESLFDQTDKIFKEAMEEGFLTEPVQAEHSPTLHCCYNRFTFDRRLEAKGVLADLQGRVRNAGTLGRDCLELLKDIRIAYQFVEGVRDRLMTLIQEERHERMKDNIYEVSLAPPPPAHLHNPSLEHHPFYPPISRPSSFSVEIQGRDLSRDPGARQGLVRTGLWRTLPRSVSTDLSCDRAKSGSDAQEAGTHMSVTTTYTSVTAEDGA